MPEPPKTLAYKSVDGRELLADVYRAGSEPAPVLLFLHGGALIFGSILWMPRLETRTNRR